MESMPDTTSARFYLGYILQVECNESGQRTRGGQVNGQSPYNVQRAIFDREQHSTESEDHSGLCHFLEQIRGMEGSKCQLYCFCEYQRSCVRCGYSWRVQEERTNASQIEDVAVL